MILNQITLDCLDYEASVAFYKTLGFVQIVDSPPRYARFESPSGDGATLSLHTVENTSGHSTTIYFDFPSADALDQRVAALKSAGLKFSQDPTDERWLWREARLSDPAGNMVCLMYAGENRRFPPWRL